MTTIHLDLGPVLERLDAMERLLEALVKPGGPELLSVKQVAELRGVSEATVRRWAQTGRIKCAPGVRPYQIPASEVM